MNELKISNLQNPFPSAGEIEIIFPSDFDLPDSIQIQFETLTDSFDSSII